MLLLTFQRLRFMQNRTTILSRQINELTILILTKYCAMIRTLIMLLGLYITSYCNLASTLPTTDSTTKNPDEPSTKKSGLLVGADQLNELLPLLGDKNVGLLVNHTALTHNSHIVDTLVSRGVKIKRIFGPEHGF